MPKRTRRGAAPSLRTVLRIMTHARPIGTKAVSRSETPWLSRRFSRTARRVSSVCDQAPSATSFPSIAQTDVTRPKQKSPQSGSGRRRPAR